MKPDILKELYLSHPSLVECAQSIDAAFQALVECFSAGGTVLVCGNGGSAADAEHIVGELMNKFARFRPIPHTDRQRLAALGFEGGERLADTLQRALPAICLSSQSALITAIANDMDAQMIFAQQVYGYGRRGDVLLALSTSGNSPNILNALKVGRLQEMKLIGMTGHTGGAMGSLCDVTIRVPATTACRVQELHLPVYHALCELLEERFFGS